MASLGTLFIILVVGFAAISSVNGQTFDLGVVWLKVTPYTVYYLTGQRTLSIGIQYLPHCSAQGATGKLIQLTNTNTGVVVAEHNQPFTQSGTKDITSATWDFTQHSTLNSSYTGLYRCTSDITGHTTGRTTYQLHVVVPPTTPVLQTPVSVYNDTLYNINCTGRGYPEPTVTLMVNNAVLPGSDTANCTAGVCTKTHTASLDGSNYTLGQSINITCTVDINQPQFTCTPALHSISQKNCTKTAKTSAHTRTVPVLVSCQRLEHTLGYDYNASFSTASGTVLGISCRAGFTEDASTSSIDTITCQDNGMWTRLPTCTVAIPSGKSRVSGGSMAVMASLLVIVLI
ncbi:uncharacterized protein LOC135812668 [Sycon ciliatum]|uniref:uncharacterized protein LOC135812668 n=1 Tax=Sycon ciliatum TaxID=27933 RepID=UPI0031F6269C